jgi:hypothetical protein
VLFSKKPLYNIFQSVLLIAAISHIVGCKIPQKEIRAYIDFNPHWKMIENCGYQGCYPMLDFLTGKEATIIFEFDKNKPYSVIKITFLSLSDKQIIFDPTYVSLTLSNSEVIKVKVFSTLDPTWYLQDISTSPSLKSPISVKEYDNYLIFFDYTTAVLDKELILDIDNSLSSKGKPLGVPLIYFRKNLAR